MDNYKLREKIMRALKEGAPGPEHERLRIELKNWAISLNYTKEYSRFPNGSKPDVLMDNEDGFLFVGDAKDSNNETTSNSETLSRVQGYFSEFANLLGTNGYKGGTFAIATNSSESAEKWVHKLNTFAITAGITGRNGKEPNFKIENTNAGKTWIIYW